MLNQNNTFRLLIQFHVQLEGVIGLVTSILILYITILCDNKLTNLIYLIKFIIEYLLMILSC